MLFWQRWFINEDTGLRVLAGHPLATPSGSTGAVADLAPETDSALISRTVRGIIEMLQPADLLEHRARHAHG